MVNWVAMRFGVGPKKQVTEETEATMVTEREASPIQDTDPSPEAVVAACEEVPAPPPEPPPPARLPSRRDRKRQKVLERAGKEYGADLVRHLETIRDVRERIVYVAEVVFARKGFAGARTQEIADIAGINKAMIHYYFDSKVKLYHAVLDKILFDLIKLTQETIRDDASEKEQLQLFFLGFLDYAASHRNFTRLAAMNQGTDDRYLERMVETFFKPLFDRGVAFIKRGIDQGVFSKKVKPRQFLVSIYGMTSAYFAEAEFVGMLYGEDPLSDRLLKERREQLLDIVFAALGCSRP
jgi:TetR/AcrR family transcriptional regulator